MEAGVRIFSLVSLPFRGAILSGRPLARCWSCTYATSVLVKKTRPLSRALLRHNQLLQHGRLVSSKAKVEMPPTSSQLPMDRAEMAQEKDEDLSFPSADHPLTNQTWKQFITSDEKTIVCVHPAKPAEFKDTKPLRSLKPWVKDQRTSLTDDEVKTVQNLRSKDGSLWTVNTLAQLFNVKRAVIRKVAPANLERQAQLDEDKALMSKLKPYKRRLLRTQKQIERQKRLETIIAQNRELSNLREKSRLKP